jgi:hypothetical protein
VGEVAALDPQGEVHRQLQALVHGGQDRLGGRIIVVRLAPVDSVSRRPDHHAGGRVDLPGRRLELRHVPGRHRRTALADPGLGPLDDLRLRRHGVDQPHALRHGRADLLALEQHLERVAGLHEPRDPLRAAAAREQADLDLRKADPCLPVVGGDPVVARQRQFEGAAQAQALDRRREGLAAGLEAAEQQGEPPGRLEEVAHRHLLALLGLQLLVGPTEALQHGEVGAAGEIVLAGGDDAALDRRIGRNLLDDLLELVHHPLGDHVHRTAGHVPGRQSDAVGIGLEAEIGQRHGAVLPGKRQRDTNAATLRLCRARTSRVSRPGGTDGRRT